MYLKVSGKANGLHQSTKPDELKYIDEESRLDFEGLSQRRAVHRTPTVMSIGPLCSADSIVRSCSVGYLDLVDAQMVPCDVALKMLRKDAPNKRLVLVSRKPKKRRKNKAQNEISQQTTKPPRLRNCGKSRSLDSSDIFPSTEQISLPPKLSEHAEEPQGNENTEGNENVNSESEVKKVVEESSVKLEESQMKRIDSLDVKEKPGQVGVIASPAR